MKKIFLILIVAVVIVTGLNAQSQGSDSAYYKGNVYHFGFSGFNAKGDSLFTSTQIEAEFPGGAVAWRSYLERNLKTSVGSKYIKIPKGESSAIARVNLNFQIDELGNIQDIQVDSVSRATVHEKIIQEAIRVIKKGPTWTPAWQNGKNVRYRALQSISFVSSKD